VGRQVEQPEGLDALLPERPLTARSGFAGLAREDSPPQCHASIRVIPTPYGDRMFAAITSVALVGVEPRPVRVEVHIGGGGKKFTIVGLPDASVREAKERVRAAVVASGRDFPSRDVIVNLSPANLPKAGSAYDLPIALALLVATKQVKNAATGVVALGELALDGAVRRVVGDLAAALVARQTEQRCVLPAGAVTTTTLEGSVEVIPVATLNEAIVAALGGDSGRTLAIPEDHAVRSHDLQDVRGQDGARRALEIAAAGGHHLLMTGAPGAGKTMLARCLPSVLPPLPSEWAMEAALAWSAAGLDRGKSDVPPFRAPHHSATLPALVGGGSGVPVPGEVTLAHRGVLFLDELGEFPVSLLDALRQPVEDGCVVVARKGVSVRFPSRFQLVAATNPCPCGYAGDHLIACRCSPRAMERYRRRFSGPLLDRIDLRVRVARLDGDELVGAPGESSAVVRERVTAARKRQVVRGCLNAGLARRELDGLEWTDGAGVLLRRAVRSAALTGRGWDRVRRVAATVADLDESSAINEAHVSEALAFRGDG
jgi:magnesium chelatase family protein